MNRICKCCEHWICIYPDDGECKKNGGLTKDTFNCGYFEVKIDSYYTDYSFNEKDENKSEPTNIEKEEKHKI